jgi:hypothetical protein
LGPPSPSGALPPGVIGRRSTSIDFAENQLFPGLIGLSPLATAHPRLFQQAWVRPSSGCYPTFSLAMARSPGFGSPAGDSWTRLSHSLSLRLRLAAPARRQQELADPLYKRYAVTPRVATGAPTARRRPVSGLFHSPRRGAFHLSLTVLVHYRSPRSI